MAFWRKLLSPKQRKQKYMEERSNNIKQTDSGVQKVDKEGNPITMNDIERSYRAGYIRAYNDCAVASSYAQAKSEGRLDEWKAERKRRNEEYMARKNGNSAKPKKKSTGRSRKSANK